MSIEFSEVTSRSLLLKVGHLTYVGGTNKSTLAELRSYIGGKSLDGKWIRDIFMSGDVDDHFSKCYFRRVRNALDAEDKLLAKQFKLAARWNHQQKSNLQAAPGIVYVLK